MIKKYLKDMHIFLDNKKYLLFLLVIGISCIPLVSLFHPGLPITHDGQDHVARIANFYQNLIEGNIIPRWAGNLNWGYGHPILMFLYPLSSYCASLFHFLGFSFVESTKLVFGLAFILSGLTMYLFVKELLDEKSGLVASALYLFAPYRFIDLYVRGAIGEHVAFIFPPLICYFFLKSSKKYSDWYVVGGVFSLAGLILSHNAITLMFLPIIFLYALFLIVSTNKKTLIYQFISIFLFGFGISAFFWAPAFFEGKYTLRDVVTRGEYASRFVGIKDFLYGPWSYGGTGQFTVQIGIIQWLMVVAILPITIMLKKRRNNSWIITVVLTFIFFITLFFMTASSRIIWEKITILQKFQFPWRFLSITVFITALFGGFFVSAFGERWKKIVVLLITCLVFWFSKDYWHVKGYLIKPESFFSGIYPGTTDTGESAPIWSIRFMEHRPKANIEIIQGKGEIKGIKHTSTQHTYVITTNDEIRVAENTLFFPGWEIFVNEKNVPLQFQDPQYRGIMTFFVPMGSNVISVRFRETKLRAIADVLSVISLFTIIGFSLLNLIKLKRK